MPYLTPDSIPEDDDCRPLFIPASTDWLAFFGGALTELTKKYNWQQWGAVTVDETVAKMQEIIDGWYSDACGTCVLPGGGEVIRIGEDGRIEQLIDGEWSGPTGDYIIPPPAAREGGTEVDQNCLAAANAVNVLHELYTSLSDSFSEELTDAAALVAFIEVATLAVGFAFAPIAFGIASFAITLFGFLYGALSYLTADLWDDDFEAQMRCFLVECASNDAGVVMFDWQCFNDQLNSLADSFSLSEVQIRLYLQVGFILQFIGGADGLNLAGGTMEITSAECPCEPEWCYAWNFEETDGSAEGWYSIYGDYSPGVGYVGSSTGGGGVNVVYIENDTLIPEFSSYNMTFIKTGGGGTNDNNNMQVYDAGGLVADNIVNTYSALPQAKQILVGLIDVTILVAQINAGSTGGGETVVIKEISVHGTGINPFGEDNC